ncbi:MAG: DegT/DnrJ/EryC1/StrS family aminotransferase [Isosphaeraceae bacterium]|nr:DegT/DnrJ/EryC1/StrS family aminotransferase [Isosphaeraceae bacterium]
MHVPLSQPSITEVEVEAVLAVLRTPTLSLGPRVRAFERAVAEYVGVAEAVAVNSGTSGLHLCLAAAGIGPGDEVITTPFSFVASANCALYQGARPVFADIDPRTLNLDPAQVEARITSRTRAIVAVDVFGQPAPIEALRGLADRHDLALIQDACEAIGAERNGRRIGSLAKAAVFAFYPNKQITAGEGGMVVTDDRAFARVLRSLSNQGRDDDGTWMNHVRLGYNYRLDEMSAALGLAQLGRLDEILDRRAWVAGRYNERLAALEAVRVPHVVPETTRMSWFVYVVRLDGRVDRDALMAALEADGIPSRPYFVPIHLQPLYRERFGHRPGDFPVTERVARTTLALPFFTDMTEGQIDYVCDRLAGHLARQLGRPRRPQGRPSRRRGVPA